MENGIFRQSDIRTGRNEQGDCGLPVQFNGCSISQDNVGEVEISVEDYMGAIQSILVIPYRRKYPEETYT